MSKSLPFKSVLKLVLLFISIAAIIDIFSKLISSRFNVDRIFNWDYFLYEVILEGFVLFISGLLTHAITRKATPLKLDSSIWVALGFTLSYSIVSLVIARIVFALIYFQIDFSFDWYDSFFRFAPHAFWVGLLYVIIWTIEKQKARLADGGE